MEEVSLFDFSVSSLLAGLIFSAIGIIFFRLGKKQNKHEVLVIGLILMIYPMFSQGPWQDWGIGAFLTTLAYLLL